MSLNSITGPLPSCLGQLLKLVVLHLKSNSLTGSIPSSLCLDTSLTYLNLQGNDLGCYWPCLSTIASNSHGSEPTCSVTPTSLPTSPSSIPTHKPTLVRTGPPTSTRISISSSLQPTLAPVTKRPDIRTHLPSVSALRLPSSMPNVTMPNSSNNDDTPSATLATGVMIGVVLPLFIVLILSCGFGGIFLLSMVKVFSIVFSTAELCPVHSD